MKNPNHFKGYSQDPFAQIEAIERDWSGLLANVSVC
jgi:hypothetical protein